MTEHSWHEEELLASLRRAIEEDRAAVLEDTSDLQAEFYANFPIGRPLVDWDKVPDALSRHVRFPTTNRRVRDEAGHIVEFWNDIRSRFGLAPDRLAWVAFDSLVGFGVLIEVGALDDLLVEILDCVPANAVVASADFDWAMTYSTTGWLDFGMAPPRGETQNGGTLPITSTRS